MRFCQLFCGKLTLLRTFFSKVLDICKKGMHIFLISHRPSFIFTSLQESNSVDKLETRDVVEFSSDCVTGAIIVFKRLACGMFSTSKTQKPFKSFFQKP